MLRRSRAPGFTLVEVMITVAIIAVLGTLAVYGVKKYVLAAKSSEAAELINVVKTAQESYKDETFTYLNISPDLKTYYPNATPNDTKVQWGADSEDVDDKWRQLGVAPSGPVQFGYACVAGGSGDSVPIGDYGALDDPSRPLNYPQSPGAPWYVVVAVGNRDNDDKSAFFAGSSFTDEIYSYNDTE